MSDDLPLRSFRAITVFCGSNPGSDPAYTQAAVWLASELVRRNIRLVYGGASVGLMGTIADAALAAGGEVEGIMPQALVDLEVAHNSLTSMHVTTSMHERKALMAERADAFIALPGGLGTIDEVAEMLTWTQLGMHDKPVGLLNISGFYDGLLQFFDRATEDHFLRPQNRNALLHHTDPGALLDALQAWRPVHVAKWVDAQGNPIRPGAHP